MVRDTGRDDVWRYVLSAGRTGTVFLETLLSVHAPGVTAVHEPPATRYQMMLANLRNDRGIGHRVLRKSFEQSRLSRMKAASGTYLEINPFLCPLTDLLPDPRRPLRVVHMVREPGSWARSISAFKASRKFRWLIDCVPFARPYPSPRPPDWRDVSEFEKALWRWRWCNERITALRNDCAAFVVVRYEDLFSNNLDEREAALTAIVDTLALPPLIPIEWAALANRVNRSPPNRIEVDREATQRICGDLARDLGYAD